MLGGLKLLLDRSGCSPMRGDRRLPALLKKSREAQAAVSTALAEQVLGALHELLRGLDAADARSRSRACAHAGPAHLYEGLLTVLMRLVFVLYAEDRDLLPSRTDGARRRSTRPAMRCAASTTGSRAMPRSIPTRWTSGAAAGASCWRCSG